MLYSREWTPSAVPIGGHPTSARRTVPRPSTSKVQPSITLRTIPPGLGGMAEGSRGGGQEGEDDKKGSQGHGDLMGSAKIKLSPFAGPLSLLEPDPCVLIPRREREAPGGRGNYPIGLDVRMAPGSWRREGGVLGCDSSTGVRPRPVDCCRNDPDYLYT